MTLAGASASNAPVPLSDVSGYFNQNNQSSALALSSSEQTVPGSRFGSAIGGASLPAGDYLIVVTAEFYFTQAESIGVVTLNAPTYRILGTTMTNQLNSGTQHLRNCMLVYEELSVAADVSIYLGAYNTGNVGQLAFSTLSVMQIG